MNPANNLQDEITIVKLQRNFLSQLLYYESPHSNKLFYWLQKDSEWVFALVQNRNLKTRYEGWC